MSQQATRTIQVTVGNNARALNVPLANPGPLTPAPQTGATRKARTPLSLVVSTPRRSSRALVTGLFLVVLAALTVVLVMSISVSKGQYELVGLKNQQSVLHKSNQSLEQEIAAKSSPQELVARAAAMGMVPAATTGQIDVRTKKVSGSPMPAAADTKGLVVIPPALIDKPQPVVAAQEPPAMPSSPAANAQKDAAAKQAKTPVAPSAVAPALNGGTIPAPVEKDN
ncbi:hypothetical protein AAGW05_17385 [Arthrobacter sp. LAPM80]|uniref:hypothetical protein n=1 Tax=Arthrobacter sp. LAPM80 TaxID=3141788 RepID=UPI00398A6F53